MKKRTLLFALLIIIFTFFYFSHKNRRPLKETSRYSVKAYLDGELVESKIFEPIFVENIFFIKLGSSDQHGYEWLSYSMDERSFCSTGNIYESALGYTYIHSDESLGVSLSDPKIEDKWSIRFEGETVLLKNKNLEVRLDKLM